MDANDRMPGDAEAAAAAAGMAETYGRDIAGGDWITFRRAGWPTARTASGRVHHVQADGWIVEVDGEPTWVQASELVRL